MLLGQLDSHVQKNEVEFLPHTTYKKLSQNDQFLDVRAKTIVLEENIGSNIHDYEFGGKRFLDMTSLL
jgi:hypothetical protein